MSFTLYSIRWRRTFFLVIIFSTLQGCKKESKPFCDDSTISLYEIADFRIGAAVNAQLLASNDAYRNIVINQFDVVVPESAYLTYKIQPSQGYYNFTEFDYIADFCKQHNKHLEGSNLFYQLYLPQWMSNFKGDRDDWENLTKSHIQTVVARYKGVVESWMVVNEALNEDGTLANNIWREHLGDTYIEKFYQWAHEADPNAMLFYNDYNLENNNQKLAGAIDIVNSLKNKGLRIDGIGLQMHNQASFPTPDEVAHATSKIIEQGFKVYFSEWDISFNLFRNKTVLTDEMKEQQKYLIKTMVRGYRQIPKKYQHGISFWNVGDADSWIRPQFNRMDWPLMWDDNYKPKPAYCGFMDALNEPL